MTLRRRALMASAMSSATVLPYNVAVVGSLILHQAANETLSTQWRIDAAFGVNTASSVFTLANQGICLLNYSKTDTFQKFFLQNYCIVDGSNWKTMYYFPAGCTVEHTYNETSGLYTVTARGRIQVYTL